MQVMKVAKKCILEIIAKCFHNKCITQMVDTFIDLLRSDPSLPSIFMQLCFDEDAFDYLFTLLLECTDLQAR